VKVLQRAPNLQEGFPLPHRTLASLLDFSKAGSADSDYLPLGRVTPPTAPSREDQPSRVVVRPDTGAQSKSISAERHARPPFAVWIARARPPIHAQVTNRTLEDPSSTGRLGKPPDKIVIGDDYRNVIHEPPSSAAGDISSQPTTPQSPLPAQKS
jgi:hypothetical protein